MSFTVVDYALIFGVAAAWFVQPFSTTARARASGAVDAPTGMKKWADVPGAPPRWLFGAAWFVLYTLLTIGTVAFIRDAGASAEYVWVPCVILANLILNKMWLPLFFGANEAGWAFAVIILTLGTAIAATVGMAIAASWLAFAMWLIYSLWLAFATYLNGSVVNWASTATYGTI